MMYFLMTNNVKVYVNPSKITYLSNNDGKTTSIWFEETSVLVKGNIDDVAAKLMGHYTTL